MGAGIPTIRFVARSLGATRPSELPRRRKGNDTKMKKYLYISAIILSALACGLSPKVYPLHSAAPTPPAQVVEMIVIADALNIRAEATYLSAADPVGLRKGEKVKIYLSCTGGEVREWVSLDRDCTRWVKASWMTAYP